MPLPPPRSGETPQLAHRIGGCFMVVFGMPFFAMGGFFTFGIVMGKIDTPHLLVRLFAAGFTSIFAIIGGAIIWGGIRNLLGFEQATGRPREKAGIPRHFHQSPCFPKLAKTNTTGLRGGVVLPPDATAEMSAGCLIVISIFWIVASGFGLNAAWSEAPIHVQVFAGFFVLIGLLMFYGGVRQALKGARVGDVIVETRSAELRPGERQRFFVSFQKERLFEDVEVTLELREHVVHGSGTDRVNHKATVFTEVLQRAAQLHAGRGRPGLEFELQVPESAMHSFKSPDAALTWGVRIKAGPASKPEFDRFFPFLVVPEAPVRRGA